MNPSEYLKQYKKYESEFQEYFGETAEEYFDIWRRNRLEHLPLEYIAETSNTSLSRASRIVKNVERFLSNPKNEFQIKGYSIEVLQFPLYMPSKFVGHFGKITLEAHKMIYVAVYLYQYRMVQQIPKQIVLEISSKYQRVKNRTELINELCGVSISGVKIFKSATDNKGAISFELTEDFITEINR